MELGKLDIHLQKSKVESLYHIKINPKWVEDLNLRTASIKLLEENRKSLSALD